MLETERLILRNFSADPTDLQALLQIMEDPIVNRFLPWFPLQDLAEAENFYQEKILPQMQQPIGIYWAICLKENNLPIGYLTLSAEDAHDFGYGLRREFWNQGIVTEAAQKAVAHIKESNLPFITATHDVENPASGKVMQKLGMSYQYSYQELCQPKNTLVIFRLYQLNFSDSSQTYQGYWEKYPTHFIEDLSD